MKNTALMAWASILTLAPHSGWIDFYSTTSMKQGWPHQGQMYANGLFTLIMQEGETLGQTSLGPQIRTMAKRRGKAYKLSNFSLFILSLCLTLFTLINIGTFSTQRCLPLLAHHLAQYDFNSGLILLNAVTAHCVTLVAEFAFCAAHDSHASGKAVHTFIINCFASFFSTLRPANATSRESFSTVFTNF